MMEEDVEVWQQMFQELMQEVKPWHKWTLTPDKDLLPDVLKSGWTQYQQKTFARFHCSSCSRSWVSGRVLMLFHMRWCEKKGKGQVKMRVFAQRCNQCPEPPFAAPEFTWDNISRILNNLLFRILKKCYKEGFMQVGEIPLLGDTSLQGPHDSNNCEACLHGFCVQSGLGPASQAPAPPLSPTSSKSAKKPKVTASYSNVPCPQPSSNVEKSQASKVNPKASNSTKDDPKASHTSKQSTVPILTTQQLSLVSPPTPRCVTQMLSPIESNRAADVANKSTRSKAPKASASLLPSSSSDLPTSSSSVPPTSSSYVALTSSFVVSSSKVEKPQTSKVKPKTKVNHISKPSTTPILTIQQLSHVSSPTPRCVIQMPSPILSSRAADVAKKSTRSNTQKASLSSSSYAPPTSSSYAPPTYSLYSPLTSSSYAPPTPSFVVPTPSSHVVPNSWRPANTTCQIERSSHVHSQSESFCCKACCEGCGACCEAFCKGCCECFCECPCKICCACCEVCGNCMSQNPCLVFLIFVVIVVVLIIKYGL